MANLNLTPIFASDQSAAKLLDLKPVEFRKLVESGDLPGPRRIGEKERWDMQELRRIISGEAVDGIGEIKW